MGMTDLIEALSYEIDAIRGWIDAWEMLHPDDVVDAEDAAQLRLQMRRLHEIARELREAQQRIIA